MDTTPPRGCCHIAAQERQITDLLDCADNTTDPERAAELRSQAEAMLDLTMGLKAVTEGNRELAAGMRELTAELNGHDRAASFVLEDAALREKATDPVHSMRNQPNERIEQ